jgi:putative hydrolase of the HAD superfamily
MKVETILFDLDETLIEEEASNDLSALAACDIARRRHELDVRVMLAALRARSLELWRAGPAVQYCRDIGISSREGLWGAFTGDEPNLEILRDWIPGYRIEAWASALVEVGVDDRAMARELADFFVADRKQRHVVFPESRAVLEQLRSGVTLGPARSRVKIGMITNGASDIQRAKIEGSGLAEYFDTILVSGEEGFGKPKPEIFRLAIDRLGVDEASTVMIGDSLARDITGASNVGIKSVWVNRMGIKGTDRFPAPDAEMCDLAGLPELLEKIL